MDLEAKYKAFTELGGPLHGLFIVKSITHVNHKPHPFMIGPKHIGYAAHHCGGMLGKEAVDAHPCAKRGCRLPYDEHTSDHVLFLAQVRNLTDSEAQAALKIITADMESDKIDGIAFVETPEKFRITKDH